MGFWKLFYEKNIMEKENKLKKEMNSDLVKDFVSAFPDAKLISVTEEEDAWFYRHAFKSKGNAR